MSASRSTIRAPGACSAIADRRPQPGVAAADDGDVRRRRAAQRRRGLGRGQARVGRGLGGQRLAQPPRPALAGRPDGLARRGRHSCGGSRSVRTTWSTVTGALVSPRLVEVVDRGLPPGGVDGAEAAGLLDRPVHASMVASRTASWVGSSASSPSTLFAEASSPTCGFGLDPRHRVERHRDEPGDRLVLALEGLRARDEPRPRQRRDVVDVEHRDRHAGQPEHDRLVVDEARSRHRPRRPRPRRPGRSRGTRRSSGRPASGSPRRAGPGA